MQVGIHWGSTVSEDVGWDPLGMSKHFISFKRVSKTVDKQYPHLVKQKELHSILILMFLLVVKKGLQATHDELELILVDVKAMVHS